MSGRARAVLLWLGVPALLIALAIALLVRWASPPSSDALKEQFRTKRAPLEALIKLMNEDGYDGFCLRGAGLDGMEARLKPERLEEYRARMHEADVQCVFRRGEASIQITAWAFGFPGTHNSRGFIWSLETLPPHSKREYWEWIQERLDPEWAIYAF